ncbi:hypothetical protein AJ79_09000 [Helicocarpus griseus UAMH5409]|uniref:N-acetyltransferase domain-containing protein n=1 Tax=Helicocarpus griseus UAMH5409 TaxID=1447875 RepID=A0A2B7WNE1_9EURO|nr:hypothetical protein AJ79_09000 [Helicocarpus griseus UAMH5409]
MSSTVKPLTHPSPILGIIKAAAFEHSMLSSHAFNWDGPAARAAIEKWYTDREALDMQDPTQRFFVSVATSTDDLGSGNDETIAAWARWGVPHTKPDSTNEQDEPEYKRKKKELIENPPTGGRPELLGAFFREAVAARRKYLNEERDYVLELIATSPNFERQGHGSRLLKCLIDKAEADNARIYLEATMAGLPVYERLGWKTVDEVRLKLADYGIEGDLEDVFYIMIREPQGPGNKEQKH